MPSEHGHSFITITLAIGLTISAIAYHHSQDYDIAIASGAIIAGLPLCIAQHSIANFNAMTQRAHYIANLLVWSVHQYLGVCLIAIFLFFLVRHVGALSPPSLPGHHEMVLVGFDHAMHRGDELQPPRSDLLTPNQAKQLHCELLAGCETPKHLQQPPRGERFLLRSEFQVDARCHGMACLGTPRIREQCGDGPSPKCDRDDYAAAPGLAGGLDERYCHWVARDVVIISSYLDVYHNDFDVLVHACGRSCVTSPRYALGRIQDRSRRFQRPVCPVMGN
ncbi:MAG: hypothetical protein SGPRY_007324 [Prymnesium sp.]